jgi:outer membrane protein
MSINRKTLALGIGMLMLCGLSATGAAWAKPSPPIIAVVDVQAVMNGAEAAKGIKAQIDKVRTSYQQTLQGKNEELRKLDEDLQRQRSLLAPEAYQQRQKEFDQKVAEAQREIQVRRSKIEQALGKAMQHVEGTVKQIVDQIAKESGFTLVLPKAAVIHAEPEMDITREVLKRLNAKLPSVTVNIPK